jgi:DNA-binding NarL/FixJ family response regulator
MLVRVLLADDHVFIREGIRAILDSEPSIEIVGETGDGLEVLNLVEKLIPDVLVLDIKLPGLNGLEVVRQIDQRGFLTRIIILSMLDDEPFVLQALKNGAKGYITKGADTNELIRAIHEVMLGRFYLSPPLSERAIEAYLEKTRTLDLDLYDTLTNRERQVLQLAAEGRNNPEIAQRLVISPRTAERYRSNIMRKLRFNNQTDLIRYAIRRGILSVDF